MRKTAILCLLAIGLGLTAFSLVTVADAFADGSGSAVPGIELPSSGIDDPLANPQAAWDDVKAAKLVGWGVAILVALIIMARVLARLGGVFAFLGKGKAALVIAGVGATAIAAYDALMLQGSWVSALAAALIAAAAYWNPTAKPKTEPVDGQELS